MNEKRRKGSCARFYPSLDPPASTIAVAVDPLSIFTFRNGAARVSLAGLATQLRTPVPHPPRPSAAPAAGSLI